ncbi:MAG: redoxin domain-containing protein [Armatimonadaceae bacterium]
MKFPVWLKVLLALLWLTGLAMLGLVLMINARLSAPPPGVPVGSPAPDFTLPSQEDRAFHLSDYKGRPVYLAFVPDLGPDTRVQAKSLQGSLERFEETGGKAFLVVPLPMDAAKRFHTELKLDYPVLCDPTGSVAKTFGVKVGGRETVVVSPSGKVGYHIRSVDVERHGPQVVLVAQGCADEVKSARVEGVGDTVADFSLPRADGGRMTTLFGDRSQKATVVLFVSVRCPCSNAYNARVRDLIAKLPRRGVRVLVVYSSADESAAEVADHAHAQDFNAVPVLKDEELLGADHFKATVTPQAFVIDKQSVLRYAGRIDDKREADKVTRHDLEDALTAVLAGKPVQRPEPAFGCAIPRTAVE